jgi:hypothetical protein
VDVKARSTKRQARRLVLRLDYALPKAPESTGRCPILHTRIFPGSHLPRLPVNDVASSWLRRIASGTRGIHINGESGKM